MVKGGQYPLALNRRQLLKSRLEVGKHLMMLGNIAAGSFLFGQAVSGQPFDTRVAILGIIVLVLSYVSAWKFMKGGGKSELIICCTTAISRNLFAGCCLFITAFTLILAKWWRGWCKGSEFMCLPFPVSMYNRTTRTLIITIILGTLPPPPPPMALGKRGCWGYVLQHPRKKIRGCAAPPGNFHVPQKAWNSGEKGSNIDVRTGAALFFFACQRGWWCTIVDWYPYSVCGKLTKRNLRPEKNVSEFLPWILYYV